MGQIMKVQFMYSGIPKERLGAEQLCNEIILNTFHDFTLWYTDASVLGYLKKNN